MYGIHPRADLDRKSRSPKPVFLRTNVQINFLSYYLSLSDECPFFRLFIKI